MSVPPDVDERQIVSYLLGRLTEDGQARVEQNILRDADYRRIVTAIEDDLIDEYVRGELSGEDRVLFEGRMAALPHLKQKVGFSRDLLHVLPATAPQARAERWSVFGPFRFSQMLAFSAAAILLAFGLWRLAAPKPGAPITSPPTQATGPQTPRGPLRQPIIVSFILPAGTSRTTAERKSLTVPVAADTIRLQLELEQGDAYPAYAAELRTAAGRLVWNAASVPPASGGRSIVLDIPATALDAGDYELKIASAGQPSKPLGYYYFTLLKQ